LIDSHTFGEVCEKLQEKDYKLTPQRKIIIETLLEHADKHLSAEDVYNLVKVKSPDVGLATVYRTVELLAELSVLEKLDFGDGRSRYEFSEEVHHHHHLLCVNCGKVLEMDEDLLESVERRIYKAKGFKVLDHQVKFFGLCVDCQKK
jgi:Fur family ferric uptake transcriptional regulator